MPAVDFKRLVLQRLEIGDDVADLAWIEPEFRHRRVPGPDSLAERFGEILHRIAQMQEFGTAVRRFSGLSVALSIEWQRAQFASTNARPRCSGGDDCANAGLTMQARTIPAA